VKRIIPKNEIIPNYLWHIYAISNIWAEKKLEYSIKYKSMMSDEDKNLLNENRTYLAWGNGRGGVFSGFLFFIPLSFDEMTYEKYLSYLHLLIESVSIGKWDKFKDKYDFEYDMTNTEFSEPQIEFLRRYLITIEKYFYDYRDTLWKEHNTFLNETAVYLIEYFRKLNAVEKWEMYLNKKYPYDEFKIILTVANKNLPSANNLSRNRYNFYYQPNSKEELCKFILHEIGTNLLTEELYINYEDKELQGKFITDNNLIWQSFEVLAEYCKSKIFKVESDILDGNMFGGGNYYFKDFFDYYETVNWNNSNIRYSSVMKDAIIYVTSLRDK